MKIHEAIAEASKLDLEHKERWFRPISWKGTGQAFAFDMRNGNEIVLVPSSNGGTHYMTNSVMALTGEWELVDPDAVLDEELGIIAEEV